MRTPRPIAVATPFLFAALGGGLLLAHHPETTTPALAQGQGTPPVTVQTAYAEIRNVSRLIALPGDVHPWAETTLYAKVPGYLGSISVDRGDRVQAGETLAIITAPELKADQAQAQQSYRAALASVQGGRATEATATAQTRRARTAAEKAQADALQAPASVARAQAQLAQTLGVMHQAEAQRQQALAGVEESRAQATRAQADLEAAKAEQQLAEITYSRYKGIYDRNPMLIAKQDVDTAEGRVNTARSKTAAAQSALQGALAHAQSSATQVESAAAQAEQAQAQVAAAQQQVTIAQAQQAGWQKQVAVAKEDVQVGRTQQAVTRAKTAELKSQAEANRNAALKTAALADYAHIRAPFSGTITKRFVDPGAFIQTASSSQNAAAIVTVADLARVRLFVSVPEVEAGFIRVGTPVKVALSSQKDAIAGRVTRTEGVLDPKTRTLTAEIDLSNPDGKILPGAYAMVKTTLETHSKVVSVPSQAIGSDKSGKFVFVVENGKAKRVVVVPGFDDGAHTEIKEGLHGQEEVIVTNRDAVTPNAPVHATPWTPPTK